MTLTKWNRGNRTNGTETPYQTNKPSINSVFDSMWPTLFNTTARPMFGGNLIQDFFDDTLNLGSGSIGTTLPAVNISETDNELVIEMAAPGMEKKDFKVELNDNQLQISYQKERNNESNESNHWRREYNFSSFERTFSLPTIVEGDKIAATYTNGILRLSVPKKEEARKKPARNIEIK